MCILGQFISECYTRVHSQALGGVPLLAAEAVVKDNWKELIRCIGDLGFNCREVNLLEKWGNKQEEPSWVQNKSLPQALLKCHLLSEMNLDHI